MTGFLGSRVPCHSPARRQGLAPHIVCADYTIPALVAALAAHFARPPQS